MELPSLKSASILPHSLSKITAVPWQLPVAAVLSVAGLVLTGFGLWQLRQNASAQTWQPVQRQSVGEDGSNPNDAQQFEQPGHLQDEQLGLPNGELGQLFIDVGGAVNTPGLYRLGSGDRVAQAVMAAGGLSDQADSSYIARHFNLAASLTDGQKIYIPHAWEATVSAQLQAGADSTDLGPAPSELISINHAPLAQLQELPGIGQKRSQDIIDGRPYQQLDDLIERSVIPQSVFDDISTLITL
ncbi:MAG: hypothetical protein COU69_04220 [Candidatus Pacebacteria bacterium CG10_big_fil_rev_8_21_14_0_10_56_10]|nr:MAG: hypothetical protein COU69_04220 [Candidatus Pacebacteria bacterium CG10_big_fil_rev_8_21_14_0_10_56_10]